ncbi:DUF7146 domain-containing protein [Acinetobacter sp.]|uniref:DUF7146 domain-containing protein n=1 Tax=Acinetobacter sp. TaxID=472 RepID=UPI003D00B4C5
MSSNFYDQNEVKAKAEGSWLIILSNLAPELNQAIERIGRHVPCPIKGGKDGFRLFKDANVTGGGISNKDGPFNNGFSLLQWVKGWDFPTTLNAVGDFLMCEKVELSTIYPHLAKKSKPVSTPAVPGDEQPLSEVHGKLVDFGSANFNFEKEGTTSFFIKISFKSGNTRTLWGIDLKRALNEASAIKGDFILIQKMGKKPVQVTKKFVNEDGEVQHEEITSNMNRWNIINKNVTRLKRVAAEAKVAEELSKEFESDDEPKVKEVSLPAPVAKTINQVEVADWLAKAVDKSSALMEVDKHAEENITRMWNQALPLSSDVAGPGLTYLNSRKINVSSLFQQTDTLRFHPDLPYYDEDSNGKVVKVQNFPALVAAIRDVDGNIVTLHRTYLNDKGGKAKVENVRKMCSVPAGKQVTGAAIQLGGKPLHGIIGVAEGMETALSAFRCTGIPTWSCVSASIMEQFIVPAGVHTVLVWADKDRSYTGELSANALKTRLESEGFNVIVLLPQGAIPKKQKSIDWNDVLMDQGIYGFPPISALKTAINAMLKAKPSSIKLIA